MPKTRVPALPAGMTDDPTARSIIRMLELLTTNPDREDAKPIMTILANLIARYPADDRERFLASAPTRLREMLSG